MGVSTERVAYKDMGVPTEGVSICGVSTYRGGWVDLPKLEKRAVSILLGCFLVIFFSHKLVR